MTALRSFSPISITNNKTLLTLLRNHGREQGKDAHQREA